MASEIKSDKLSPSTGTALQIGDASDTITIPTGATFTVTDGIGVAGGGTGLTSFTAGDVLYATGTTTLAKLAKGTAEQGFLSMNSGATAPEWATAAYNSRWYWSNRIYSRRYFLCNIVQQH